MTQPNQTYPPHSFEPYVEHTRECEWCRDAWRDGRADKGCPEGQEIYNTYKAWNGPR